MSLNYDLTAVSEDVRLDDITNALVWYCMGVGIPELTETTLPEFYARMRFTDLLDGTILRTNDGKPRHITIEELRERIGIKTDITNVGLQHLRGGETRAAWMRRVVGGLLDTEKRRASR